MNVPIGELFTILGHNGAGKSTLINILTGNISPSFGTAKINDADIIVDPESIEELIGLCPQHDILWEELTAEEHIQLYARLRSKFFNSHKEIIINKKFKLFSDFEEDEIPNIVNAKLKEVNLESQKNLEVKTYSGGMKRRLSILLSTVGNPKVVFLDEPTTGLDPVNKRFIWSMIQKIKSDKAVILTTHSMEEADFLSDRIGVIVEGNFKCIGTSIDLKHSYGGGYLLTFGI